MQREFEHFNLAQDLESSGDFQASTLRTDFCIRPRTSLLRFAPSISLKLLLNPLANQPSTSVHYNVDLSDLVARVLLLDFPS